MAKRAGFEQHRKFDIDNFVPIAIVPAAQLPEQLAQGRLVSFAQVAQKPTVNKAVRKLVQEVSAFVIRHRAPQHQHKRFYVRPQNTVQAGQIAMGRERGGLGLQVDAMG